MTPKELADEWKSYDNNAWGVFAPIALYYGLGIVECGILRFIHRAKLYFSEWERCEENGITYIWVDHSTLMNKLRILGITNSDTISKKIKPIKEKGVLLSLQKFEPGRSKVYYAFPPALEAFLFAHTALEEGYTYEDIATKWLKYLEDGEGSDLPRVRSEKIEPLLEMEGSADSTKAVFSDEFMGFIKKAEATMQCHYPLYKRDGGVQKAMIKAQSMYYSALDGSFFDRYKPSSKKYNFADVGKVTENEIIDALKHSAWDGDIAGFFMSWKGNISALFTHVCVLRGKQGAIESVPTDNRLFNQFIDAIHKYNKQGYRVSDAERVAFWKLHVWYDKHHKDIDEINHKGPSFKGGLGTREGEWFANYLNRRNIKPTDLSGLNIDHPFWKAFATFAYKGWGIRIILDDGIVRRADQREREQEALHQIRGYEIDEFVDDFS